MPLYALSTSTTQLLGTNDYTANMENKELMIKQLQQEQKERERKKVIYSQDTGITEKAVSCNKKIDKTGWGKCRNGMKTIYM